MPTCAVLWQLKPIINHLNEYDKHKHLSFLNTGVSLSRFHTNSRNVTPFKIIYVMIIININVNVILHNNLISISQRDRRSRGLSWFGDRVGFWPERLSLELRCRYRTIFTLTQSCNFLRYVIYNLWLYLRNSICNLSKPISSKDKMLHRCFLWSFGAIASPHCGRRRTARQNPSLTRLLSAVYD